MHIFENNQEQLLKNARELAENRSIKVAGEKVKSCLSTGRYICGKIFS